MIEIKGKYNEAKIFTDVVDSASIAQVQELCNQEFTAGSRIRLMPDIHAGKGCTIGTTMTIIDRANCAVPTMWISSGQKKASVRWAVGTTSSRWTRTTREISTSWSTPAAVTWV